MSEIETPKLQTRFNICSMTLTMLGCEPISSFDEGTTEAKLCKQNYEIFKNSLLAVYPWKFATRQEKLGRLAAPPLADFRYSYQPPNDVVRFLKVQSSAHGRPVEYQIRQGRIESNAENLIATYIYIVPDEDLPDFFIEVLIAKLAAEFSIPLTESSTKANLFDNRYQYKLAIARNLDAQQATCNVFSDESLVEVR